MVTSVCLITGVLLSGQLSSANDFLLGPRLVRGLELDYQGVCIEETLIPRVTNQRQYAFATRVFVMEPERDGWQVAFMTALGLKSRTMENKKEAAAPVSIRLEVANVNRRGKVAGDVALALDGLPTIDRGAVVEFPKRVLRVGSEWMVTEPNRPPLIWKVVDQERCNGAMCLKIVGEQLSTDWRNPRADRAAWRRQETVWVSPQFGFAYKVERVMERRDPARTSPTHRTTVRYEMRSPIRFPGNLYQDRRKDIVQANKLSEEAAPLFKNPAEHQAQLNRLLGKIEFHLKYHKAITPYRQALIHLQRQIEKAKRGELVQRTTLKPRTEPIRKARVGRQIPNFVVASYTSEKSISLDPHLGRPILMIYYRPQSQISTEVLRFAQNLKKKHGNDVTIFAMAVTSDPQAAKKEHHDLQLAFPILDGQAMQHLLGVDATPRIVLLDGKAFIRHLSTGWGFHTAGEVTQELERWLPK